MIFLTKYICIHGHFYQPPRENPWLEEVELQDSAYPFHDWNEKVTDECYAPNAYSRIKNEEGKITDIVNNYARMSFNFGPTLLSWMEYNNPEIYKAILKADELSISRFSGHGSAIAQVYNHMIMPLANKRDKVTQVRWGIEDFQKRFGRTPEGMWLPETAVDLETLEVLADHGIKFTILAPHQAEKFRHKDQKDWQDADGGKIDPKKAYYVKLHNKRINVFFYDGITSQELAFQDLLNNGVDFANRLMKGFTDEANQLMHIATDGETYGHHRSFGDMTLAYCLNYIENNDFAELTNYGEFLEKFPPEHEVKIKENTSWSCIHGVKRWWTDCGCNSGEKPGWQQKWREPLRNSMDWLRDQLALLYEKEASKYFDDSWEARNNYIRVVNDRSEGNVDNFFRENSSSELSHEQKKQALKLLEMQRNNLLMYTSCGWFFDEVSGIETVQVIQYAARSIQLAQEISDSEFEKHFLHMLEKAPSNVFENAGVVYKKFVRPAFVDLHKIGAHYAVSSLFNKSEKKEGIKVFSYHITDESYESFYAGKFRLVIGKSKIFSEILWEETEIMYGVLWLGDHNIIGGVSLFSNEEKFREMKEKLKENFDEADIQEVIKLINDYFAKDIYSLRTLFKDEQRNIINQILQESVEKAQNHYREIYEDNYTVTTYLNDIGVNNPSAIQQACELAINHDLQQFMKSDEKDLQHLKQLVDDINKFYVNLDTNLLSMEAGGKISKELSVLLKNPDDTEKMDWIIEMLELIYRLPLSLNLWRAQNLVFSYGKDVKRAKEKSNESCANVWLHSFEKLCDLLQLKI